MVSPHDRGHEIIPRLFRPRLGTERTACGYAYDKRISLSDAADSASDLVVRSVRSSGGPVQAVEPRECGSSAYYRAH